MISFQMDFTLSKFRFAENWFWIDVECVFAFNVLDCNNFRANDSNSNMDVKSLIRENN